MPKKAKQYVSTMYVEAEQFNYPNEVPIGFEVKRSMKTGLISAVKKLQFGKVIVLKNTDWVVRNYNGESVMTNENFCRAYVAIDDVHTIKITNDYYVQ